MKKAQKTKMVINNPEKLIASLLERVSKTEKLYFIAKPEEHSMFIDIFARLETTEKKYAVGKKFRNGIRDEEVATFIIECYKVWLKENNLKPLSYYRRSRKFKKAKTTYKVEHKQQPKGDISNKFMNALNSTTTNHYDIVKNGINAKVDIDANGKYVLKANSIVANFSDYTLNSPQLAKLVSIRNANSKIENGTTIITNDIVCSSSSQCASLIYGTSKSGNVVFNNNSNTQPKAPKTPKAPQQPKVANQSEEVINKLKIDVIKDIKKFCKDFEYEPDNRVINSLYHEKNPTQFLLNAMELTFSKNFDENLDAIRNTLSKCEWVELMKKLKAIPSDKPRINQRLAIYYGQAGTGKTESACFECGIKTKVNESNPNFKENTKNILLMCSRATDPSDMWTQFNPTTKSYELTPLGECAKNGGIAVLDDANNLPTPCHQSIQTATSNVKSFIDPHGVEIVIGDGFKVIMTLNLTTNVDGKRPLPNPIVSRAMEIRNYNSEKLIEKSYTYAI